jgi:hypothetical protein
MTLRTLYDFLGSAADRGLRFQKEDGSFPPGYNGSYDDPETPVRNTGHWLITFLKAYEIRLFWVCCT